MLQDVLIVLPISAGLSRRPTDHAAGCPRWREGPTWTFRITDGVREEVGYKKDISEDTL